MSYSISNAHTPFDNIDGTLVNIDNSHVNGIPFSSIQTPSGPHTLPAAGSNVQSAAGIYPAKGGGKRNKISRKYKMGKSKHRRTRSRKLRHKRSYRHGRRSSHKHRHSRKLMHSRKFRGGGFQPAATAPSYPAGHSQYQNNNGSLSNTYSLGGPLSSSTSALANPPPYQKVAGDVDNLNHNTLNAYGNIGAGSGFASRGWF